MDDTMDAKDIKYLDGRFTNIEDKMDAVIVSVGKIEGEVVSLKIQTALNEDRLKQHINDDQSKESKSQWTVGNVITIGVCIASILGAAFL